MSGDPAGPLRYAYNTNGLKRHGALEAIHLLADLGYDAVELALQAEHLHPLRATRAEVLAVRDTLRARGLAVICGAGVPNALGDERFEPSLFHPDPDGRARRLEYLRASLEVAAELGAGTLVFCTGTLARGVAREAARGWLIEGLSVTCEVAATLGLQIGLEPEPGHFVETLDDYRRLRRELAHDRLGLTVDVGHVYCTEPGPPEVHLRRLLRDERVLHVQIEDMRDRRHEHLPFGAGAIALRPVLGAVLEHGYDRFLGVELSRHSERGGELAAVSLAILRAAEAEAARIGP